MRRNRFRAVSGILTFAGMLMLSACGSAPGSAGNALAGANEAQSSVDQPYTANPNARAMEEEQALLADPGCAAATGQAGMVLDDVVARFNGLVADGAPWPVPVGHPDAPENGVAVRVCAGSKVAAYSYDSLVVLHEGLLSLLNDAATAKVLYGSGAAYDGALLKIAMDAEAGIYNSPIDSTQNETMTGEAGALFASALAFVTYHELGHSQLARQQTPLGEYAPLEDEETRADLFAAEALRETGYSQEGANLVFEILGLMSPGGSLNHASAQERLVTLKQSTSDAEVFAVE
ncbi:MAG: hypothetical protein HY751_12415 [Nitrospinae bacterium]|nr:hypothetical protein [Nitrospinota bacterium]